MRPLPHDVIKPLGTEKLHQLPEFAPRSVRIATEDGEVLWERELCLDDDCWYRYGHRPPHSFEEHGV